MTRKNSCVAGSRPTLDLGAGCDGFPEALPAVDKPTTVRCLGPLDTEVLTAQVARLSDAAWRREDGLKENSFGCLRHTRHIVFRFIKANRDPRRFYSRPAWLVWKPWLQPLMASAATTYGFREPVFPKAMLARLAAGQRIDLHRDGRKSHPLVHKIHVPLQTDPRAMLIVDGVRAHLSAGHAWEVNNLVAHGAHNGGVRDRIHFVFEVFEGAGRRIVEEVRR